ncbi:MAG TPA: G-D-S-L family lipolytic protein [Aquaticitalea sp.]|nr:G-D-S-L family lipolytic protein [Aquaticitalea sp.]HNU58633.1 G-D-S-L family lipolytic protein [Aquaticitalea sp.]
MKTIKYLFLSAVLIGFTACNEDDYDYTPDPEPLPALTNGSADFSKYVAVGASFSAGFTDNALFIAGQQNSFPNMLSQQFALVGGGSFSQPLMSDNIGGFLVNGTVAANPRLYFNGTGPVILPATPTTEITTHLSGSFNNYGIPGLKSFHMVVPGYGSLNPYFGRMASSATATVLADAVAQNPTFFSLSEIGGNDVLSYATSGGTGVYQLGNLNPATYASNDITDPNVFAASFSAAVDALTANGAKGVVSNVPYITSLAYFTTVPYNPVPLDQATADQLNAAFAAYNGGLDYVLSLGVVPNFTQEEVDKRKVNFVAGQNAVLILDEDLTDLTGLNPALTNMRQTTPDDLLVLTSASFIGTTVGGNPMMINGVSVPLGDQWVLTPEEQTNVKNATDAYNQTIEAVANSKGLALVDFKSILIQAATTGYPDGDFIFNTSLVRGGLCSLDGVHLTARGYAAMANAMLKAIDATYGSNFNESGNLVNSGAYPTNYPPTLQ